MNKAYLNPTVYRVTLWLPFERTSYEEPVATAHYIGSAASLTWAARMGRQAARDADGWYTIGEKDGADWLVVNEHSRIEPPADYGEDEIPW